MGEDCYEEDRVEVWDGGGEANNSTPSKAHSPVGDVILPIKGLQHRRQQENAWYTYRLARVCPPPASQQTIAMRGLDESWVLDRVPG